MRPKVGSFPPGGRKPLPSTPLILAEARTQVYGRRNQDAELRAVSPRHACTFNKAWVLASARMSGRCWVNRAPTSAHPGAGRDPRDSLSPCLMDPGLRRGRGAWRRARGETRRNARPQKRDSRDLYSRDKAGHFAPWWDNPGPSAPGFCPPPMAEGAQWADVVSLRPVPAPRAPCPARGRRPAHARAGHRPCVRAGRRGQGSVPLSRPGSGRR
jgi:hypothetical protein